MGTLPYLRKQNKVTDIEMKNFLLYCPKCKQESLVNAKDLQVTVIKRFEVKTKS